MPPTGGLLVTPIFRRGSGSLGLPKGPSPVVLALHKAGFGRPFWVTQSEINRCLQWTFACPCLRSFIVWTCTGAQKGTLPTPGDNGVSSKRKIDQPGRVAPSCHLSGGWLMEYGCLHYVLLAVLRACPDQVGTLQGQRGASCDVLVDNDMGTGSGWQQSKQNRAVSSVVGK